MSDDAALRKEFDEFRKRVIKEFDEKERLIRKLRKEVDELQKEQKSLLVYVNRLMAKADALIKSKFDALRRTQIIDRQKISSLDSELGRLSRKD